jgi:predicted DNA-binding protein
MRVMAIQMEDSLFEEFKVLIEESGKTQKAFVIEMIERELDNHKQQQTAGIEDGENSIKWERESVVKAIDDFVLQNNRAPSQKEFRSDNGLPSYKAAQRCLEQSPSEYCKNRIVELQDTVQEQESDSDFTMGM